MFLLLHKTITLYDINYGVLGRLDNLYDDFTFPWKGELPSNHNMNLYEFKILAMCLNYALVNLILLLYKSNLRYKQHL